jgi:hypothetical protein
MILLKSKRLNIGGIALFPFVIINSTLSDARQTTLINHERIHIRQQIELLVLPFYIWYLLNYLFNRYKYKTHNEAYRNIIFEREAFENESEPEYLAKRRPWSFL